jgi:hypothetical protein
MCGDTYLETIGAGSVSDAFLSVLELGQQTEASWDYGVRGDAEVSGRWDSPLAMVDEAIGVEVGGV